MKDKRMKLSSKIYLGFGTILLIAIILGVYALINLGKIQNESNKLANEYVPEVEIANRIERYSLDSMYEIRGYLYSENEKYLDAGKKALASVNDGLKDADKLANESKNLVRLKGSVDAINESVDKYENKVGETVEVNKAIAGNREQLDKAAGNYISTANELLEGQNNEFKKEIRANASGAALLERLQKITWINDLIDLGNGVRIANFKAQATRDLESLKLTMTSFDDIEKVYAKTRKITRQPQDIENLNSVRQAALNYKAAMTNYLKNAQELRILNGEQDKIGSLVVQKARELSIAGMAGADEIAKTNSSLTSTSYFSLIIGLIIAVLVGAILSFTITNGITKTLNAIVNELRSSAKQIFMAARELSNASQELASSSNEQASSIEETSSSLEELSGMVRNNLDNAQNGYDLSLKVKTVSDDGM
ncbi:MAG: MCP four helix bundle domain-containing protein, partial [bacterium]